MAEGTFPSTLRDDSLLPDEDRDATGGALPLRSGHVDRLHHQLLATLGGAGQQILCVPKGDLRRSRERVPSRWVLDVATALAGETWWSDDLLHRTEPWLIHLASFDDAVRTAAVPATEQEHRLRRLLALDPPRRQLHAAAEGRTTIITRHGRAVAAVVPADSIRPAAKQSPITPIAGTGKGLWGKDSTRSIAKLRDEWSR